MPVNAYIQAVINSDRALFASSSQNCEKGGRKFSNLKKVKSGLRTQIPGKLRGFAAQVGFAYVLAAVCRSTRSSRRRDRARMLRKIFICSGAI
jgi:hypothetical protein